MYRKARSHTWNPSRTSIALGKEPSEPSSINVVSSANWLSLCSTSPVIKPFTSLSLLMKLANISADIINRYGDIGQPCQPGYIEASSSYFILRPSSSDYIEAFSSYFIYFILFTGSVFWTQACPEGMCTNGTQVPCEVPSVPNPTTQLFWGILIFYFEVPPHFLYWGFVLIFDFEASSSLLYIEAMFLSLKLWSSLLLAPVALFKFVLLIWFVCSDMCVVLFVCFLSRVTRCKYYLVWISIHIFFLPFLSNFSSLFVQSVILVYMQLH